MPCKDYSVDELGGRGDTPKKLKIVPLLGIYQFKSCLIFCTDTIVFDHFTSYHWLFIVWKFVCYRNNLVLFIFLFCHEMRMRNFFTLWPLPLFIVFRHFPFYPPSFLSFSSPRCRGKHSDPSPFSLYFTTFPSSLSFPFPPQNVDFISDRAQILKQIE